MIKIKCKKIISKEKQRILSRQRIINNITENRCPMCKEWKTLENYGKGATYCIKCTLRRDKDYYNSEKGKEVARKKILKFYNKVKDLPEFKLKAKSHTKVQNALKTGHIPKSNILFIKETCSHKNLGNCSDKIVFHHTEGYDKPYNGIWLCQRHHILLHKNTYTKEQ